jgi:GTP pyrophosphokinase
MGARGQRVEFQIRTKEMHANAEEGIAAHWRYKEDIGVEEGSVDKFEWLRRIMESLQEETDPKNLVDSVKLNLFQDEVFVFTPLSEVKSFPRGATPVDFAYAIHTEVGQHCVGAKVNGRIVPLSTKMDNGDVVEILTNPHRTPGRDWLKFVVTPRAKQKVRGWIRQEQRHRSKDLGKELLEHEISRYKVESRSYMKKDSLRRIASSLSFNNEEELLASIGFGRTSARQVVAQLLPEEVIRDQEKREKSRLRRLVQRVSRKAQPGIQVKGQDDVLIRFGKCCNPIPGDPIIGFITRGRGVTVHSQNCSSVRDLMADRERLVEVDWGSVKKEEMHVVNLSLEAVDRPGVLADLSAAIASLKANITRVEAESAHEKAGIRLDVQVHDLEHLNEVMKKARGVKGILSVLRLAPHTAGQQVLGDTAQGTA